ncbi:MAG: high-potential iron-sulfur protein [Sandaracinaceae bacterium]
MANSSDGTVGRRHTLRILGAGGLTASGLVYLAGCGGGDEGGGGGGGESAAGQGCDAPIEAASQTMRNNLQYRPESPEEGKQCNNCAQYVEGQYGECGGCNLFQGPVQPGGHCLSWAALEEGGGAAAAEEG